MLTRLNANLHSRLSPAQRQRLRRWLHPAWLGSFRPGAPLSDCYGFDRGKPVDRYYIEQFLQEYRPDISGHVLEVKDSTYTNLYGAGVHKADVLDIDRSNSRATIIADLTDAGGISADEFDCFVLTQTMQLIYNVRAALDHVHRMLRPGGVLLATMPSVSRIVRHCEGPDYWRFTPASCARLFGEIFGCEQVTVRSYGNLLSTVAFLRGMASDELSRAELDTHDRNFPLIIAVRAVKLVLASPAGRQRAG